jgi:hypothetical protein
MLPQTVTSFLADLQARAGQVRDLGAARLLECADPATARLLVHDRRLRGLCDLAGERRLVFQATDEAAVRKAIKELGYVLPPVGEGIHVKGARHRNEEQQNQVVRGATRSWFISFFCLLGSFSQRARHEQRKALRG